MVQRSNTAHLSIFLTQECGTVTVDGCLKKNYKRFFPFHFKGHFKLMRVNDKTNDRGQKAVCTLAQQGVHSGLDS